MQLHQPGDVLDGLLVEAQRRQPLARHARPHVVVPVEGDGAVGQEAPRGGLADVVHDGRQAQHEVRARHRPVGAGLQVDGLVEDRQGVLVDVLVAPVLVDGLDQGGQLGQDDVGHAGVHHELQPPPGPGREQQALQLGAHALGGDDLQARSHLLHGGHDVGLDVEPQLGGEAGGAHDAQRVVVEGLHGAHGSPQHPGAQVVEPSARIDELKVGQPQRHGVDGEVAPSEIALKRVPVGDHRLAGADLVLLGAVGRRLHDRLALARPDRAELLADVPAGVAPGGQNPLGLLGTCGGRAVQIVRDDAEKGVTHRTPDEGELIPGTGEGMPESRQGRRQCAQGLPGRGTQTTGVKALVEQRADRGTGDRGGSAGCAG